MSEVRSGREGQDTSEVFQSALKNLDLSDEVAQMTRLARRMRSSMGGLERHVDAVMMPKQKRFWQQAAKPTELTSDALYESLCGSRQIQETMLGNTDQKPPLSASLGILAEFYLPGLNAEEQAKAKEWAPVIGQVVERLKRENPKPEDIKPQDFDTLLQLVGVDNKK